MKALHPNADEILLNAVLRVAHAEGQHREWNDMEPILATIWERLRSPTAPRWEEVAERVRVSAWAPASPVP